MKMLKNYRYNNRIYKHENGNFILIDNNPLYCKDRNKLLEYKCPACLLFIWKCYRCGTDRNIYVSKQNIKTDTVDFYNTNEDNINNEIIVENIILYNDFININEEELNEINFVLGLSKEEFIIIHSYNISMKKLKESIQQLYHKISILLI